MAPVQCTNRRLHVKIKMRSFREQQESGYYARDTETREHIQLTSQRIRTRQIGGIQWAGAYGNTIDGDTITTATM